jgi:choline dehydrogenase-like flavoprotein
MPQVIRSPKVYDVCIVGSGAGGGTAAKVLTEGGLNVVLLEAGPRLNPAKDFKEHVWPYQLPHRGADIGGRARHDLNGEFMAPNGFWDIEGEPYTTAPGSSFRWFRSRIEGGRTNHYGRISLRISERDLKYRSHDGLGDDWPITYAELSPYYDKAESFIGVFGTKEGLPYAPDGIFLPPPKMRCTETIVKKACDHLNITCIPARMAMITKPVNGRPPCHYCGQCGRGCVSASNFSSSQVMIPPAQATGRFTMIPNAMAREVIVGKDGKAKAISYIDKETKQEMQIHARAFVIAASSCESARLLLNSKSSLFPNGLANSSGAVGRNLTDSVGANVTGYFPQMAHVPPHNHDGIGGMHMYMPWWRNDQKNDFPRGYHIEFGGGPHMPTVGSFDGPCASQEGYGSALKKSIKSGYGQTIGFSGRGEMIPNADTYCEIDPSVVDKWGIPVLRFHFKWSDYEVKMAEDMRKTFASIIEAGGGTVVEPAKRTDRATKNADVKTQGETASGISIGGSIIHELGTVRMGDDPKTSPLNKYSQAHDVKNLFVTDGAVFVTQPDKNPTLTILALSWRASDYLLDQAKKGDI